MVRSLHGTFSLIVSSLLCASSFAQGTNLPAVNQASVSTKGSLLIFPAVELKWDSHGFLSQDTIISITNDVQQPVSVQFYLVNGDPPLAPMPAGENGPAERAHPGWNWADCQLNLTANQPTYWSAATGLPAGCQRFTVLDSALPPGRPDPDGPPGSRVLRGFVVGWAVNGQGHEIHWNHLSGEALTVNYGNATAWEYSAYAFEAVSSQDGGETDELPGLLRLDGNEYDAPFDRLLFNFNAVGSQFQSGARAFVTLDTDLTLMPVAMDLRQDNIGPLTTKAKFDIWNMNETRLSGTERCVTCWDQTLLSKYADPNNFIIDNLQTDVGKARIDGITSTKCDNPDLNCNPGANAGQIAEGTVPALGCSLNLPLLGVASKLLAISGTTCGDAAATGLSLVGLGAEPGAIIYDIVRGDGDLRSGSMGDGASAPSAPEKPNIGSERRRTDR